MPAPDITVAHKDETFIVHVAPNASSAALRQTEATTDEVSKPVLQRDWLEDCHCLFRSSLLLRPSNGIF